MDRKAFLASIGLGAATVAVFSCVGCSKSDTGGPSAAAPTGVDFTLDLTASTNAALKTNGGYIYSSSYPIIIARTTAGDYIAVSQTCRHENTSVIYRGNNHQFYCQRHGATYSETGVSAGIETNLPLTKYNTQLNGTNLRIYS